MPNSKRSGSKSRPSPTLSRPSRGSTPNVVEQPPHYTRGGFELTDVIEAYGLGWLAGNCVKYLLRYQHKGNARLDLEKAQWYLKRLLEQHGAPVEPRPLTTKELEALVREASTGGV